VIAEIEAQPDIGLGRGRAEHADGPGLDPEILGDELVFLPFGDVRHAFLLQELAHGLAERLMLLGIGKAAGDGIERHVRSLQ
ncbi:hypothetical protein BLX88_22925, partial [Bacillus obstructivus]